MFCKVENLGTTKTSDPERSISCTSEAPNSASKATNQRFVCFFSFTLSLNYKFAQAQTKNARSISCSSEAPTSKCKPDRSAIDGFSF